MTLSNLIRKGGLANLATATTATLATQEAASAVTVAPVATVAVATPKDKNTALPPKVGDTATASCWWRIHYPSLDSVELACCPEATHADILKQFPDAVAAEPFTRIIRQPSEPMTAATETIILGWLAFIGETNPVTIAMVMSQCREDAEALAYFTRRARGLPC